MDTEEMYRRGVADAEQGEPNPFYYQHYYYYRRGYDQGRRRARRGAGPAGLLGGWRLPAAALLALAVAGAGYALLGRREPPAPPPRAAAVAPTRSATFTPARTPIFPTATLAPTPTPLVLRVGGVAQVTNTSGRPLRGRTAAGLDAPARVAFEEGERVQLLEGPVEADGYTWWRIEGPSGTGWSAQQSPEGTLWLTPIPN